MNRRAAIALLSSMLMIALVGAGGCVPTDPVESARSRSVTIVMGAAPSTLIPYAPSAGVMQVGSLVFQSLVAVDESGTPVPDLAVEVPTPTNGLMLDDGRKVIFKLDPGARWHDGEPVTAADVVFTVNLMRDGVLPPVSSGTWRRLGSVEAVDPHTVALTFSEPDYPGALRLVPYVLPKHLLSDSRDIVADEYWDLPIGSGPYRVEKVVRRKAVTLRRVRGEGPEELQCVFNQTPSEQRETWDKADRAVWPGSELEPIGSERIITGTSAQRRYFLLNAKGQYTSDPLLRRAIIDMLVSADSTSAVPGAFGIPFKSEQRPARAKASVSAAGWSIGSRGMRYRSGRPLEIDFAYLPESEADGHAMDRQVKALQSAGISARVNSNLTYGDFYSPDATLVWTNWDVARVVSEEDVPFGYALPFDADDAPSFTSPSGLNVAGVDDPELERIADRLRRPVSDAERRRLRTEYGQRLRQLSLVVPDNNMQTRTLVKGVSGVAAFRTMGDAVRGAVGWRLSNEGAAE